jgi:hypothetical protein
VISLCQACADLIAAVRPQFDRALAVAFRVNLLLARQQHILSV